MSIRVVCPNGHVLNVKDALAGKTGLCPRCKARVVVPAPQKDELSEDSIMSILGPHASTTSEPATGGVQRKPVESSRTSSLPEGTPPKKSCHKCNREISVGLHICPFCHTYIAKLSDF